METTINLDRLEDFVFLADIDCAVCPVKYSKIDCPYRGGVTRKYSCEQSIIKHLRGEDE